jgi:hypothetical protein
MLGVWCQGVGMLFSPRLQVRETIRLLLAAVALVLFAGGCAMAPSKGTANEAAPVPAGHQRLHIYMTIWVTSRTDFPGMRDEIRLEELPGVKCSARNDKGAWEMITPGTFDVAIGDGPLTIECTKAGFRAARVQLPCVTPRTRSMISGALWGLQLIVTAGTIAVVAAPAAVAAALAPATAGSMALGAAAGSATAGPDPDVCNYSENGLLSTTMWPEEKR